MTKRPLCLLCICFLLFVWLSGSWKEDGISSEASRIASQNAKAKETVLLTGYVYKGEVKNQKNLIYLKNTYLKQQSQLLYLNRVMIEVPTTTYYSIGNKLEARGILREFSKASNPGEFDMKSYYRTFQINYRMQASDISVLKSDILVYQEWLRRLQLTFANQIRAIMPEEEGALMEAMILGMKNEIGQETLSAFQLASVSHVLVISGLHLSLLGMGLYELMKRMGSTNGLAAGVSGFVLVSYTILTGASASTIRAFIMFLTQVVGRRIGRTYDLLTALAFSVLLLLGKNPAYLGYSGFWLSVMAVLGVGLVQPMMEKITDSANKREAKTTKKNGKIKKAWASYISIQLMTLPLILCFYGEIPTYGFFANLLILPSLSLVLLFGLVGIVVSLCSLTAGKLLVLPAVILLKMYILITKFIQKLPWSTLILGSPKKTLIVGYYLVFLLLLYLAGKWGKKVLGGYIICLILVLYHPKAGLTIVNLNVGQGDCSYLETRQGTKLLIDGGSSSESKVGKYRILPFLKSQGVQVLDYMILTHPDSDHMNGLEEFLELINTHQTSLKVQYLILPRWEEAGEDMDRLKLLAEKSGIRVIYLSRGNQIVEGRGKSDLQITVLHPNGEAYLDNTNEGSLTLQVEYKDFTGLFTGDLEGEGEEIVTEYAKDCDYLKVAHHGSNYSTGEDFLEAVKPEIGVLSYGESNRYGHPGFETIARLQDIGCKLYRTAEQGAIRVQTDGRKISAKGYLQ